MKNGNTSKDFIAYAQGNGIPRKTSRAVLQLMKEYAEACVASDIDFLFRGIVSFKMADTVTTLVPGKRFRKVKAYPAVNLLDLSKRNIG